MQYLGWSTLACVAGWQRCACRRLPPGATARNRWPGYGRAFADAIPGARFELLTDTGHLPQMEVVRRTSPHAFQVVRRRWVVERTFGWLMRYRRLARDYERRTDHHEAVIYRATVLLMTKRLTGYETRRPPPRRWGGDRKPPAQRELRDARRAA
jgi:transposase